MDSAHRRLPPAQQQGSIYKLKSRVEIPSCLLRVVLACDSYLWMQVRTPQKSGLEALWARAGQAGHLRLEVESARVAEQERSLEEARQHLEQWDYLVSHP